jgi:type II secretory pathway pseudopilin PulG
MTVMTGSRSPAAPGCGISAARLDGGAATANGRGFTIVEAVVATVIVAIMLVAALSAVGASRSVQRQTYQAERGRLLAQQLLAEVVQRNYQDANEPVLFGPEADESAASRADFDDVDDYDGWSASPPEGPDGTPLTDAAGWARIVTVQWIDPLNPGQVEAAESNAKRIEVVASYDGTPQATFYAIRTAQR